MAHDAARDNAFLRAPDETLGDGEALSVPRWQRADWSMLFSYAELMTAPRGAVVIEKDATERAIYFVASGLLEVTHVLGSPSKAASVIIHPGEVVGELSFLDGQGRSSTVYAIADSELYRLPFDRYEAFADAHPRLASELMLALGRVVSLRLRHTESWRARS